MSFFYFLAGPHPRSPMACPQRFVARCRRAWPQALAAPLLMAAVGASACASVHAKAPSDSPPLDMPAPPPRVVEPIETETPPPVPLVEEPARHAPARPAAPPARRDTPRTEAPKPDPKPESPPPPEPAKPAEEPAKPSTPLQTGSPQTEAESEQRIRGTLARAKADLGRINVRGLNADARQQYQTAERFVSQAEESLRQKNLVFARSVADKAAAIAAQLAGK